MKKFGIIAMTFALLMGVSQCKKENTNTTTNEGAKVNITLNVNGSHGSRVAVNTENGEVTFENNDVLYVASDGVYVGTLTYNGTNFSGDISEPTEGEKLHFYFLGNVDTEETLTEGTSLGCSVVISDQTEHLPVISYAPSRENYQVGKTDYNATLLNKCALVKFNVTTASEAATSILGMYNKVTVDFSTNEFAYDQEGEGVITLAAGNGEKWAILLPQEEITSLEAKSSDGVYVGECGMVPEIIENDYLIEGIAVTVTLPEGAVNGLFAINANGDQVYFSKGNLQYKASSRTWRFAENQYDYEGDANSNISSTYDGWIDLFGWGTSGWNPGNKYYRPWDSNNSNGYQYGPNGNYNLMGSYARSDWGYYNSISNGGNQSRQWRTLTQSEWNYVFGQRNTTSGILYAKAQVNGVNGVILLPDDWNTSYYSLSDYNTSNASFSSNVVSSSSWIDSLEAHGAVFLPAAGSRNGTSVSSVGSSGTYWSASYNDSYGSNYAYYVSIYDGGLVAGGFNARYYGRSVRLVCPDEN